MASWLHTVATRKSIDLIRRGRARRRREHSYATGKTGKVETWHDLSGHVDHILQELDADMRSVLLEHFFEGKTTTQIAEDHGISQATASRRVNQGLDMLRAGLKKRGLLATGAVLSVLLGEGASYAVPAAVSSELTKMAMVGSSVAGGIASAGAATGAAAAGGTMAGLSGKVAAAVAVVAIGVGSVMTYNHFAEDAGSAAPAVGGESSFESQDRSALGGGPGGPASLVRYGPEMEQGHVQTSMPGQGASAEENSDDFDQNLDEPVLAGTSSETGSPEMTGFAMGMMGMMPPEEGMEEDTNSPPVFWGGAIGVPAEPPSIDPNELLKRLISEDQ